MEQHITSPESSANATMNLDEVAERLRGDPEALAEFVSLLSPGHERKDGWTPFARRLFLQVLAETGRVSRAYEYAGLSVSSAYALGHRDRFLPTAGMPPPSWRARHSPTRSTNARSTGRPRRSPATVKSSPSAIATTTACLSPCSTGSTSRHADPGSSPG